MRTFLVVSSICALALGCNNPSNPTDTGPMAGDGGPDGGPVADVGVDGGSDGGTDGGGGALCGGATCAADEACVRDVCVATCGADTSGWDAALASDLSVVRVVCRTPGALGFAGGHFYEVNAAQAGMVTTFTLTRWTADSAMPTPTTVATAMHTRTDAATMVYAGGYVAVAPDEMHALFGYTLSGAGAVGGVFDVATGSGTATEIASDGNYDAAYLDNSHFLVNGAPGGAQGVYAGATGGTTLTHVVSHVGDASGSVDLWSEADRVLAGGLSFGSPWADGMTMGSRVLVLTPSALAAVTTTPVDGSTVQQLDLPSTFEMRPGGVVLTVNYDASFTLLGVQTRTLTMGAGGTVTMSTPTDLATGDTFHSVTSGGPDVVLGFATGLLFVH